MNSLVNFCKFGYLKYGIIVVMLMGMSSVVFGQEHNSTNYADDVDLEGRTYDRHHGDGGLEETTGEDVEYVTEGSTMRYFVMPNPLANPDYDQSNPFVFDDIFSTFNWTWNTTVAVPFANPTFINPITANGNTSPFVSITFGAVAADIGDNTNTLSVLEIPDVTQANACPNGGVPTEMTVIVIQKPQIGFNANTVAPNIGEYYNYQCLGTLPTENFSITFPITLAEYVPVGAANVEVKFSLSRGTTPIYIDRVQALADDATTLVVPIPDDQIAHGEYVITISEITDRISRKAVTFNNGVITANAGTYTWEVMRPVETGPIYRVPNINGFTNVAPGTP